MVLLRPRILATHSRGQVSLTVFCLSVCLRVLGKAKPREQLRAHAPSAEEGGNAVEEQIHSAAAPRLTVGRASVGYRFSTRSPSKSEKARWRAEQRAALRAARCS